MLSLQRGKITPIYESDDFGSYLIIKPEEESLIEYQIEMISNNSIPGLLVMDLRCKNNEKYLYYKITSMIPLSRFLSRKKINKRQLLDLLNQITQTMITGIDYLLYNKCYILEQDFIYMDPASFNLYMVYLPMTVEEDVNQNLRKLIIDLIINATYVEDDDQGDGFIRKIINYIKGDTFNIIGFNKLLKRLKHESHQENIAEEERVDKSDDVCKYKLTDNYEVENEDVSSETFLFSKTNEDFRTKEDHQNKAKINFESDNSFKDPNNLSKENPHVFNDFKIIAIGIVTQIILLALFFLSRSFLETLGSNIKTTYAAAILITLAVDALVIKNLLDYRKTLKKQRIKSMKNTQSEINLRECKSKTSRISSLRNNKIAEKFKNQINAGEINSRSDTVEDAANVGMEDKKCMEYIEDDESKEDLIDDYEVNDFAVSNILTNNELNCGVQSYNAFIDVKDNIHTDNKDSPWMPGPEYGSKTVVLSPRKELKPYIINMARDSKEEIPINKKEFLIGRLEDMVDCVIKNAAVGKIHALITEQNGKYYLKDLNSVNGTMINDVKLQCNEEKELKDGDRITFANSDYLFVFR